MLKGHNGVASVEGICDNTRAVNLKELLSFSRFNYGIFCRDTIVFVVDAEEGVKVVASRFIPSTTRFLYQPVSCALSFDTLCPDNGIAKDWRGWLSLKVAIAKFDKRFVCSEDNVNFKKLVVSDKILMVMCIVAMLKQLSITDNAKYPLALLFFDKYWQSMPLKGNDVLFGWKVEERAMLKGTLFDQTLSDSRRYEEELYGEVIRPFMNSNKDKFGGPFKPALGVTTSTAAATDGDGNGPAVTDGAYMPYMTFPF